jgi:AraC family transcriptional regulator of adaptative response/methylated-DNA-[protein]-cysteine methyltransferase
MMIDERRAWTAVLERDPSLDGAVVYAVRTTGVYCRPSCPSRRPLRDRVAFFTGPDEAEAAGFRPCRRCNPRGEARPDPNADLILAVCRYLDEPHDQPPTLDELGEKFAISPAHLQRTFSRIVGVSPRRYYDSHRQARLRTLLRDGAPVTAAQYDAGYGSSSSLSDARLGMPPSAYRRAGRDVTIAYTVAPCRLGFVLVAATDRGVCSVRLGDSEAALVDELEREFANAERHRDDDLHGWLAPILAYLDGEPIALDLPLDVQATAFQRKVWDALRAIPFGETRTYGQVAVAIGQPTASRAVAQACAANPTALVVPCHRVVGAGELGGYRWGVERKRQLLAQEAAM